MWEQYQITIIFVTHDIEEAVLLGDRVAVMGGRPPGIRELIDVPLARPRHAARRRHRGVRRRQAPDPRVPDDRRELDRCLTRLVLPVQPGRGHRGGHPRASRRPAAASELDDRAELLAHRRPAAAPGRAPGRPAPRASPALLICLAGRGDACWATRSPCPR